MKICPVGWWKPQGSYIEDTDPFSGYSYFRSCLLLPLYFQTNHPYYPLSNSLRLFLQACGWSWCWGGRCYSSRKSCWWKGWTVLDSFGAYNTKPYLWVHSVATKPQQSMLLGWSDRAKFSSYLQVAKEGYQTLGQGAVVHSQSLGHRLPSVNREFLYVAADLHIIASCCFASDTTNSWSATVYIWVRDDCSEMLSSFWYSSHLQHEPITSYSSPLN